MSKGFRRIEGRQRLAPAWRLLGAAALVALTVGRVSAEPVKVAPGTVVELELQHHVTSAYTPPGSPIYFRVAKDVQVNGRTVIAAGTVAPGRMIDAQSRGMVGKSGSMSLGVKQIQAVDGSWIAVDADLAKQGRSRAGATIGWIVFWGLPGLITKGVNPYLMRGTVVDAMVVAEFTVNPDAAPAAPPTAIPDPLPIVVASHSFDKFKADTFKLDIERDKELGTVTFVLEPPAGIPDAAALMQTAELYSVDGKPLPTPVRADSTTASTLTFNTWSIAKFCGDGPTQLGFRMRTADGIDYAARRDVTITVQRKEKKKDS
jgi:hypothetical protein